MRKGMARKVAHSSEKEIGAVVRHLHPLVTYGPWDLDIASAMSVHGYDAAKWAEGQGLLAELISCDLPLERSMITAINWYKEAAAAAQRALVTQPQLLAKLGVADSSPE
jgi:hypothetical protein